MNTHCFASPVLSGSTWTLRSGNSNVNGLRSKSNATVTVKTSSRRASRMTPRCQEEGKFAYNIYQDDADRSRRSVGANERAVTIQKPLGLLLEEGQDGMVFVAEIDEDGNGAESGEVSEGDVVVAVSATFGEEVWSTRGVGLDRVLKSIRIRAGDFVTLVLESPEKLSARMTYSETMAAGKRTEAREKFGEREVLDPVTWKPAAPAQRTSSAPAAGGSAAEQRAAERIALENELRQASLDNDSTVPQQNWILWFGGGVMVLAIVGAVLSIS